VCRQARNQRQVPQTWREPRPRACPHRRSGGLGAPRGASPRRQQTHAHPPAWQNRNGTRAAWRRASAGARPPRNRPPTALHPGLRGGSRRTAAHVGGAAWRRTGRASARQRGRAEARGGAQLWAAAVNWTMGWPAAAPPLPWRPPPSPHKSSRTSYPPLAPGMDGGASDENRGQGAAEHHGTPEKRRKRSLAFSVRKHVPQFPSGSAVRHVTFQVSTSRTSTLWGANVHT